MASRTGGRPRRTRTRTHLAARARRRRHTAAMAQALLAGPLGAALLDRRGRVVAAGDVFGRAVGVEPDGCAGRSLADLLPPEGEKLQVPEPGQSVSYRTHLGGVPARVDLVAPRGSRLVAVGLALAMEDADTARTRALLTLSRELSSGAREEDLTASVARALELLFPGRCFCIRLLDPGSLTLTSMRSRGRLTPALGHRLALRRTAVVKTGLSEGQLLAAGGMVVERDEPLFVGCDRATAVPLAVGGALHGVINLEYERGA